MEKSKIIEEEVLENRKVFVQTFAEKFDNDTLITKEILLPMLSDDELLARYKRIKPIVKVEELYYYLKRFNIDRLRNQSYIWNVYAGSKDLREMIDMKDATILGEFSTYHTYGCPGFFKPSIAEVLQQFPDEFLNEANAFYMLDDINVLADQVAVDAGCHKSKVRALYIKR